ncbi:VPS4-associated protein 1 [Gilbertella persicaria]|uniref:VPS4-associated protein 1 n=1 Tax=Gilbertella persicaria TaxID=101096 RepID=UPI00221FC4C6|nr:VPS4-associated protein 1 [Gilbertella persicaria]KAI8047127.1 VPS4-associated protein 1 [Gilbertella persicaria]
MSLQNLYIARLTTQERPCFVCSKFTNVVLTSADNSNSDWFYVCKTHLGDTNFCSKLGGPKQTLVKNEVALKKEAALANRKPESDSVTDLVSSIGSAWKSWRNSNSHEQDKKEKDAKEEQKEAKEEQKEDKKESPSLTPPTSPTSSSPQQPVRFVIQRDYFYLRQREYQKKQQKKEASQKLKTLQFPEVPKSMPTIQK